VRDLFRSPAHPYTRGLLRSVPRLSDPQGPQAGGRRRLHAIEGAVPDLARLPPGCAFHPRCPDRLAECPEHVPPARPLLEGRRVACFLHHDTEGRPRDRAAAGTR
jgi:oligopeptide/dipeptide ABC transporter ATP-binding protein